ncbi:MAG: ribokinase, partial [Verrucomicrobia bacterium]|nr:ribokinase [Verrucomicrobiota bacterium]
MPTLRKPRIVVAGSANTDLVAQVPRLPAPGETVQADAFATFHGGKGANQAVAAARLGARVDFIGRVGADEMGRKTRDQLRAEGVGVARLRRAHALGPELVAG